ncbi:hypothetical protein R3I94_004946 [Phoxinus phoxinus]
MVGGNQRVNVLFLDIYKHKETCKKLHSARQSEVEAMSIKKSLAKNRLLH